MNDNVLTSVYCEMAAVHESTVDDILETPELRNEFLTNVRAPVGNLPERHLLHRLVYLRKKKRLPPTRALRHSA